MRQPLVGLCAAWIQATVAEMEIADSWCWVFCLLVVVTLSPLGSCCKDAEPAPVFVFCLFAFVVCVFQRLALTLTCVSSSDNRGQVFLLSLLVKRSLKGTSTMGRNLYTNASLCVSSLRLRRLCFLTAGFDSVLRFLIGLTVVQPAFSLRLFRPSLVDL